MTMTGGCASSTKGTQKTGKTEPEPAACDACDFLSPITYSDADTRKTIEQIINYDRIYEALCR